MALVVVAFIIYFDRLHLWQCVGLILLHAAYVGWVVVSERQHATLQEAEEKTALLVRSLHSLAMLTLSLFCVAVVVIVVVSES